jgi:hypothetical protein
LTSWGDLWHSSGYMVRTIYDDEQGDPELSERLEEWVDIVERNSENQNTPFTTFFIAGERRNYGLFLAQFCNQIQVDTNRDMVSLQMERNDADLFSILAKESNKIARCRGSRVVVMVNGFQDSQAVDFGAESTYVQADAGHHFIQASFDPRIIEGYQQMQKQIILVIPMNKYEDNYDLAMKSAAGAVMVSNASVLEI